MTSNPPCTTPETFLADQIPLPLWIYSVQHNAFRWANDPGLRFWGAPDLETFRARDLSDIRRVTRDRLRVMSERLRKHEQITEIWTVYPRGVPRTVDMTIWRINWEGEVCLALMALPRIASEGAEALKQRDDVLRAVVSSAERLLTGRSWERECQRMLGTVGPAAGVDRCYFFEVTPAADGHRRIANQRFEWCDEGIEPQIDSPDLQGIDLIEAGFDTWVDRFERGLPHVISGPEQMGAGEREILEPQDIEALCVHPVLSDEQLAGFIGFDIVRDADERSFAGWSAHLIDALSAAAHMLGAGLSMRSTQARLGQALVNAQEAAQAKSAFLAQMSHELRTPLNAVIGFAQVMEQGLYGEIQPPYSRYARDIRRSGEHLLGIISDVLDLERGQSGRIALNLRTVDLKEQILQPAVRLVSERAQRQDVSISINADLGLPQVHCDPRRLTRVVVNLLSNAIKFSPYGEVITLTAQPTGNDALEVSVTDRGRGMSEEECREAVEPFVQVGARHEAHPEGVGLGLAIAREIARLHDGDIRLESVRDQGTTAVCWIPLRTRARREEDRAA
ncbi:hypothetical protein CKO28_05025 [Rhodovibrio sodomensis]|uniref:histidine kinase n=1 Tax=Rhodovibrio sodomensis TaxID=1088 RepID=A0ABS1DBR9_9PROT|nr:HAMP domain-containing sensor histidine kinase [Rhodovibrio sodomensis]MBK1667391.1 hypothetical protein [Rhodovibrio sodomensis]